jgi:hypothetical protein
MICNLLAGMGIQWMLTLHIFHILVALFHLASSAETPSNFAPYKKVLITGKMYKCIMHDSK